MDISIKMVLKKMNNTTTTVLWRALYQYKVYLLIFLYRIVILYYNS